MLGKHQCYSNIKSTIRPTPKAITTNKGYTTAALTLPQQLMKGKIEVKWGQKFRLARPEEWAQQKGELVTEMELARKPVHREMEALNQSVETANLGYRVEQRVHVNLDRLKKRHRNWVYMLRPIRAYMDYFEAKPKVVRGFLR